MTPEAITLLLKEATEAFTVIEGKPSDNVDPEGLIASLDAYGAIKPLGSTRSPAAAVRCGGDVFLVPTVRRALRREAKRHEGGVFIWYCR